MTIVDTNVISEMMKPSSSAVVDRWMASHPAPHLFTTSVTKAEIFLGIEIMPAGKRRESLLQTARALLDHDFAGRILPFDNDAAPFYAEIVASRRRSGRPISQSDAQIAAIARAHGYSLATRNVGDFAECGIRLINPWEG
jgi:predicted nucleic acid-binding protein